VLAACPEATVVDIAHELPAHDVNQAALCLESAFRAFPAGTVFLAVVDPGVGSERRALAFEAEGYRFVGPDNGIFSLVLDSLEGARIHEITNAGLFRHQVSPSFHGRDVFAPVAGFLARGGSLEDVGPTVSDPVLVPRRRPRHTAEGELEGEVVHTDRFGNLTASIGPAELEAMLGLVDGDPTAIVVVVEEQVLPLVRTYAEVPEAELCALVGGSGRLEIAANGARASDLLQATAGTPVRMRIVASPGG
jgi:S-adenosylmethionine hydrolase